MIHKPYKLVPKRASILDYKSRLEMVIDFNESFGYKAFDVDSIDHRNDFIILRGVLDDRLDMVLSELDEFMVAHKNMDKIEMLDAIIDAEYFIGGIIHFFRFDISFCDFLEDRNEAGEMINELDIEDQSFFGNLTELLSMIESIKDRINSLKFVQELDFSELARCIIDILSELMIVNRILGLENIYQEAFHEIHSSNMSKLCVSLDEVIDTIEGLELSTNLNGAYSFNKLSETKYVVYRLSDKKIMKSINYRKPNLLQLFNVLE